MRTRSWLVAVLVGVASWSVSTVAAAAAPPVATSAAATVSVRTCSAVVSNARPTQNSTVLVSVKNVGAGSSVSTVAHYKTTDTKKTATASSTGSAAIAYRISRATHGFRVTISVTAVKGSARWSCSTAFVTR